MLYRNRRETHGTRASDRLRRSRHRQYFLHPSPDAPAHSGRQRPPSEPGPGRSGAPRHPRAYDDYHRMLAEEALDVEDCVFPPSAPPAPGAGVTGTSTAGEIKHFLDCLKNEGGPCATRRIMPWPSATTSSPAWNKKPPGAHRAEKRKETSCSLVFFRVCLLSRYQTARSTLLERRHLVQT